MRAVRLEQFGEPVVVCEVREPEPAPGEALVRVIAAGVCGTDVKLWKGEIPRTPLPLTLGHETAGVVVEGPWTSPELPAGAYVVALHHLYCGQCRHCLAGRENLCLALRGRIGFDCDGGWADYLAVPVRNLFQVSASIGPAAACVIPDAVATSWRAVTRIAEVCPGEGVVVLGLGGLGLAACQVAQARGADVIGVDLSREKLDHAKHNGVRKAVLWRDAEEATRELPAGFAEVVLDCAGSADALDLSIPLLAPGARLVQVGYSATATLRLPSALVALSELQIRGCRAASRADLAEALVAVADGVVSPAIGQERELEEAQASLEELDGRRSLGRQVLVVDGELARELAA